MQQYDSNTFFMVAVMLNATNYIIHPWPNIAVDIVAIATFVISEEVVFYFLARILENEERESRRKKVKDTPQLLYILMPAQCLLAPTWTYPLLKDTLISSVSAVPSWPSVELSLSNFAKSDTSADVFESKFLEICDDLLRSTQMDPKQTTAQQQQPWVVIWSRACESLVVYEVHSFFTSPNLCQHTTV